MNTYVHETQRSASLASAMTWWRRRAWLPIAIADVGLPCGARGRAIPERLPGPGGRRSSRPATRATRAAPGSSCRRRLGRPPATSQRSSACTASTSWRSPCWRSRSRLMASGAVNGGPGGPCCGNALAWPAAMSYDRSCMRSDRSSSRSISDSRSSSDPSPSRGVPFGPGSEARGDRSVHVRRSHLPGER